MGEKQVFFRAKNLSVSTKNLWSVLCLLLLWLDPIFHTRANVIYGWYLIPGQRPHNQEWPPPEKHISRPNVKRPLTEFSNRLYDIVLQLASVTQVPQNIWIKKKYDYSFLCCSLDSKTNSETDPNFCFVNGL